MRSLLKRYGYQDIELGNHLDMALTIKGEPPHMVKAMLTHAVEELGVAVPDRRMKLVGSDGISLRSHVSMSTRARRTSIARLNACVNLVTKIAATDFCGYEELCALPDAEQRSSKQLPRSVVVRLPTTIEFIPVFENDRFMTTAQVILPSSGQDMTLALTEVAAIEARSGILGLPLISLGDASLIWKSCQLTLRWNHVVKEQNQLLAGAQLLSRLSKPGCLSLGVFPVPDRGSPALSTRPSPY